MKYLSLDIETTGLNPLTCDILEVGGLLEDADTVAPRERLPSFHCYIWRDNYRGEPYALAMNQRIFQKILELRKSENVDNGNWESRTLLKPEEVLLKLEWWYRLHVGGTEFYNKLTIAGKNVAGFDIPFLKQLPGQFPKFHHRVIDPGMMYFDPHNDEVPPDLKECKKRAKLPEQVSHEALDDAWDVIQLVRAKFPLI